MLIETEAQYQGMLRGIAGVRSDAALAIDTETTGLQMYTGDRITGIGVAYNTGPGEIESWYLPVRHAKSEVRNRSAQRLLRAIEKHEGRHIYHNANGVDWAGLLHEGLRHLPAKFHDTQVQAWLIDENVHHGLKEQCAALWGEDASAEKKALKKLMSGKNGKDWDELTAPDIAEYADKDPVLTLQLADAQVGPRGSSNAALAREHAVQLELHAMMQTGIRVDPEQCQQQLDDALERHTELAGEFEGINLNSPKQVGVLVYDDWGVECRHLTEAGNRSTSRDALEEMVWHEGIAELLEYRRLDKAITGYYRPYVEHADEHGRIHPSFSSTRTKTGRLSCSAPNLQTIPREDTLTGVRSLFLPEDGYELWGYDLSSAELRVMAGWAGERAIMDALEHGRDLHSETAASVFGAAFTPLQRRLAKNLNYGFAYGIGPRKFATYMVAGTGNPVTECPAWREKGRKRCHTCTVCQAAVILEGYRQTYPRLTRLMDGLTRLARKDGYLPLHIEGRYRHFNSPGRRQKYYTALNGLVQGGIGEFMKDVMLEARASVSDHARLCLQVHDELVFEVEPGAGPIVGKQLQTIADAINPFDMRMIFDSQEWSQHD